MLHYPDFRSMERSYQLMMQVAGRAGRKHKRGRVIIQTYSPQHWMLDMIRNGDYTAFYEKEINERYQFGYPPYVRMIRLTIKHKEDDISERASIDIAKHLQRMLGDRLLGPEKPYIPRINNYYLRQILVKFDKSPETASLKQRMIEDLRQLLGAQEYRQVKIAIDVDPV